MSADSVMAGKDNILDQISRLSQTLKGPDPNPMINRDRGLCNTANPVMPANSVKEGKDSILDHIKRLS